MTSRSGLEFSAFRFTGAIRDLSKIDLTAMLDRSTSSNAAVRADTAAIVEDVRIRGDVALRDLARKYDGADLESLEVPREQWTQALDNVPRDLRDAMERSARNITAAHKAFLPSASECETEPGITIGRRPDPLARVGVYAPGGRAVYPSSVLMGAVPARVAGVGEVIVCTPPGKTGAPSPIILAAAALAGVDRVFAVGGAGAISAMAYGTDSIPRVDRIVGPGNAYVAEAKLQVAGAVSIDSPAGPSELLVLADETSDAIAVAIEVIAQAEHDPRACVVVVAVGDEAARVFMSVIEHLADDQPRRAIIMEALATNGGVVSAESRVSAIAFANRYAPEHLLVAWAEPDSSLSLIRNAGTIFLGARSSVSFGDYMTGANHVLPTGGLARSYSGLSVLDFMRWTTYQRVSRDAAASLSSAVSAFAEAEGLPGHARAARFAGENG
jgi:histidinol dehydrogenase